MDVTLPSLSLSVCRAMHSRHRQLRLGPKGLEKGEALPQSNKKPRAKFYAESNKKPRVKLETLALFAAAINRPLFPLTIDTMARVIGPMKATGYKTAESYLAAARAENEMMGNQTYDQLRQWCRAAERAVIRDAGPRSRAATFKPELLAKKAPRDTFRIGTCNGPARGGEPWSCLARKRRSLQHMATLHLAESRDEGHGWQGRHRSHTQESRRTGAPSDGSSKVAHHEPGRWGNSAIECHWEEVEAGIDAKSRSRKFTRARSLTSLSV
jgi:hypothetical protein